MRATRFACRPRIEDGNRWEMPVGVFPDPIDIRADPKTSPTTYPKVVGRDWGVFANTMGVYPSAPLT